MDKALTQKIIDRLAASKNPAILAHIRPDGDAFGSLLGLGHTLKERGQNPSLYVESGMISMYQFLPGANLVQDLPAKLPNETDCVIALDTSSSLTDDAMTLLMAEVTGIARRSRAEIWLILFDDHPDAALHLMPATWRAQMAALAPRRGGGTDFAPAFAAANALSPSILIVLTDLEAPLPPKPRHPVIWAVPDTRHAPRPNWGTLLDLAR